MSRGVQLNLPRTDEPREPPEGMINLAPYAYLRFWPCLRGEIEHRTQRRKQYERNNETERIWDSSNNADNSITQE